MSRSKHESKADATGRAVLFKKCVCVCVCVCTCSVVSDSIKAPWIVAHQAPPSMEFYWQEYWGGLPFPTPGDLPDPT